MKKIIIIGNGGHAKSCIDVIESKKEYKIMGIVEKFKKKYFLEKDQYPIIGCDSDLLNLRKKFLYACIGIGQIKDSNIRNKVFRKLKSYNFNLPVIKSVNAYISKKSIIEEGVIIMHSSVINSGVKIGYNCIINNKSLIEHDVTISENCHIAPGAIINGGVKIGSSTFIGSGTVIKENVKIGKNCIISAGKFVKNNINDKVFLR